MQNKKRLREELAELMHMIWADWLDYMFQQGTHERDGGYTMPEWAVKRWREQKNTTYADLTKLEKASDRVEADKVLALLERHENKEGAGNKMWLKSEIYKIIMNGWAEYGASYIASTEIADFVYGTSEYDDGYDPGGPLNRTRQPHPMDFEIDLSNFGSNGANFVRQLENVMRSVASGDVDMVMMTVFHKDGGSSESIHHFGEEK